jgi:hypothetical protein
VIRRELLNYEGAAKIAQAHGIEHHTKRCDFRVAPRIQPSRRLLRIKELRAAVTPYLRSIPDYAQGDIQGVLLSGSPVRWACCQSRGTSQRYCDRNSQVARWKTSTTTPTRSRSLKGGQETEIAVRRKDEVLRFKVTPQSRQ